MGLIYSSSDSENLISGLRANIDSAKVALEDLVSASQRLTSSIGAGKALDGAAFNAGKDLFSALIIPTIHRASSVFDDMKKHLSQYESANEEVSGEGVLDEDKLNAKKRSIQEIKAATDDTASTLRAMASAADAASLYSVASSLSEAAQSLENYSESLQQDLDKIEDKLRKLYKFNSAVNGLFNDDLNNFKLVMQSVTVLNETVVDSKTGNYTLPAGIDQSWFTSIKSADEKEKQKKAQDAKLKSVLDKYSLQKSLEQLYNIEFNVKANKDIVFAKGNITWNYIGADMTAVRSRLNDPSCEFTLSPEDVHDKEKADANEKLKLSPEQLAIIYLYDPNGVKDYLDSHKWEVDEVFKLLTGKPPQMYSHDNLDGMITKTKKTRSQSGKREYIYSEADMLLTNDTTEMMDWAGIGTMLVGIFAGMKYGDFESSAEMPESEKMLEDEEMFKKGSNAEEGMSALQERFNNYSSEYIGSNLIKTYLNKIPDSIFGFVKSTKDLGNSIQFKLRNAIGGTTEVEIPKSEFTDTQVECALGNCFTGRTLVKTETGLRRIDSIQEGEKVYAENEETGEIGLKRVIHVYKNETKDVILVRAGKEEIETTALHRFYIVGEGFKIAADLKPGDKIKTAAGTYEEVKGISVWHVEAGERIYNLNVEDYHTYYVGEGELLVHNNCNEDEANQVLLDMQAENTVPRIKEIEVNFNYKAKYDKAEFARQLTDQENGMNKLTVDEYLKNRQRYIDEGRAIEGNMAQQAARENAYLDKVTELRRSGLSPEQAKIKAQEWMDTQAALHNPDQIAGGNPLNIGGMGDKGINSSIGSQWKYRIDAVDEQIQAMAKNMTDDEKKSTYLNVKLKY